MKFVLSIAVVGLISFRCANKGVKQVGTSLGGDSRTVEVKYLDNNTYRLEEETSDQTYGYDKSNPINVGGIAEHNGPKNERRFLNALLGPKGEETKYIRAGSCCPFKTPNGMIDDVGLLDKFRVYWRGNKDTLTIFVNMYDKSNLKIPHGLTARKNLIIK